MRVGELLRKNLVETIKTGVKGGSTVFMMSYSGVSGSQMSTLRKRLKEVGAALYVSPNTMAKRALKDLEYTSLADQIEGQTAFVWSNSDSVEVSKILSKFAKECEGVIVRGGILEGNIISEVDVKKLADLPSREVLLAMLLGVIQSPISRLAMVLNGKTKELLSILKQLSEKKGGN